MILAYYFFEYGINNNKGKWPNWKENRLPCFHLSFVPWPWHVEAASNWDKVEQNCRPTLTPRVARNCSSIVLYVIQTRFLMKPHYDGSSWAGNLWFCGSQLSEKVADANGAYYSFHRSRRSIVIDIYSTQK